ncbi:MAG TPA: hypothetical protein VFZ69_05460 [Longimicrobiales bacterium]
MNHRHAFRVRRYAFAGALALGLAPAAAQAQFTQPPAPAAYALRNVTVVQADGTTQPGQTLIVRRDRIETIARGAAIPGDANVLDGDTLYVYPGLIDAAGMIDYEFPRDTTDRSQLRSWDPPRTLQGFTPSRRVLDFLTAVGADGADLRKKGILAVAAHPDLAQPLMPGRGVLVLLRPDAAAPQQLVLRPDLAPLMTLRGGRGMYPSTAMGVMAWYRQTFLDAQRNNAIGENGGSAGPSIGFDPDMQIVAELLRTQGRVFFAANEANEIRRVLTLAEEFRFRPVIVGGAEAWQLAAELKAGNVPVLVSVDFEKPRRWKPDAKPAEGGEPPALEPAAVREKRELEAAYANAGRLARAGVTFALVSGGDGDLRAGVLKTIEHGLSEADALRALTATPAAVLDVAPLARVQQGGSATFIVTDRPLLSKDARVLYTFVEGVMEKGAGAARDESADSASGGAAANVAGTWSVEVVGPQTQTFTMKLTQDGSTVSGTMEGPEGTIPVNGKVEGNRLTLNATLVAGGRSIAIELTGEIEGDRATGKVETSMGAFDWEARRTGPGAQR